MTHLSVLAGAQSLAQHNLRSLQLPSVLCFLVETIDSGRFLLYRVLQKCEGKKGTGQGGREKYKQKNFCQQPLAFFSNQTHFEGLYQAVGGLAVVGHQFFECGERLVFGNVKAAATFGDAVVVDFALVAHRYRILARIAFTFANKEAAIDAIIKKELGRCPGDLQTVRVWRKGRSGNEKAGQSTERKTR